MDLSKYTTGYSLGVGAVVCRDEKILLVRGLTRNGPGYWHLPGGYVELHERLEDAAAREVMEEANLACDVHGVVSIRQKLYLNEENEKVEENSIYVVFRLQPKDGAEPKPDGVETCDAKFFSLAEVETLTPCLTIFRELARAALTTSSKELARTDLVSQKGAVFSIYK